MGRGIAVFSVVSLNSPNFCVVGYGGKATSACGAQTQLIGEEGNCSKLVLSTLRVLCPDITLVNGM